MPVHASNNTVNNTNTNNVKGNYLMLFFIFQFKVSASPNVPNQPYEHDPKALKKPIISNEKIE